MFPGLSCYLIEIWLGNTAKRHLQTQSLPSLPGTDLWPSGTSVLERGAWRWQQRGGGRLGSLILLHLASANDFHKTILFNLGWERGAHRDLSLASSAIQHKLPPPNWKGQGVWSRIAPACRRALNQCDLSDDGFAGSTSLHFFLLPPAMFGPRQKRESRRARGQKETERRSGACRKHLMPPSQLCLCSSVKEWWSFLTSGTNRVLGSKSVFTFLPKVQKYKWYWLAISSETQVKDTFFRLQKYQVRWGLWTEIEDDGGHVGRVPTPWCPQKGSQLRMIIFFLFSPPAKFLVWCGLHCLVLFCPTLLSLWTPSWSTVVTGCWAAPEPIRSSCHWTLVTLEAPGNMPWIL